MEYSSSTIVEKYSSEAFYHKTGVPVIPRKYEILGEFCKNDIILLL